MTGELESLPQCPQGHGQMVLRDPATLPPHMAWQGAWYECPPGPPGQHCKSGALLPGRQFNAWLNGGVEP